MRSTDDRLGAGAGDLPPVRLSFSPREATGVNSVVIAAGAEQRFSATGGQTRTEAGKTWRPCSDAPDRLDSQLAYHHFRSGKDTAMSYSFSPSSFSSRLAPTPLIRRVQEQAVVSVSAPRTTGVQHPREEATPSTPPATAFALAVAHPAASNISGGGFMMIRLPDGKVTCIEYRETAPAAAHEKMFKKDESAFRTRPSACRDRR